MEAERKRYMEQGIDLKRLVLVLGRKLWLLAASILVGVFVGGISYKAITAITNGEPEYQASADYYITFNFDEFNYELVKQYCWYAHTFNDGYRRIETKDSETKKVISMAQLFGCKGYDHYNRNTFDNRMQNLRPATFAENARNMSIAKNNSSGIIGVGWSKSMSKWRSRIQVNYNVIELGFFVNKDEAIIARLQAELEYYGLEFAPQRHLFEQYGITIKEEENK